MILKIKSIKCRTLSVVMSFFLIGAALYQFRQSLHWANSSWQITEWLINYAGGFVRRGLAGEFLWYVSSALNINANYLAIGVSYFLYAFLLFYFIKKTTDIYPQSVIFSALLMGAPAYGQFIVRKDNFIVVMFLLAIRLASSQNNFLLKCIILGGLAFFTILIHESFFFVAFPVIFVMMVNRGNDNHEHPAVRYFSLLILCASFLLSFALVVVNKGSYDAAVAINSSWVPLWMDITQSQCCFEKPSAAINALSWSTAKGISLSLSLLSSFSTGIYVPIAWVATILVCYWMMIQFLFGQLHERKSKLAALLVFQLISISPLFVLGWDFGRWIFLWTASALILFISDVRFHPFFQDHLRVVAEISLRNKAFKIKAPLWTLLFLGIPGCCWSVSRAITSSPAGYPLKALFRFAWNWV